MSCELRCQRFGVGGARLLRLISKELDDPGSVLLGRLLGRAAERGLGAGVDEGVAAGLAS